MCVNVLDKSYCSGCNCWVNVNWRSWYTCLRVAPLICMRCMEVRWEASTLITMLEELAMVTQFVKGVLSDGLVGMCIGLLWIMGNYGVAFGGHRKPWMTLFDVNWKGLTNQHWCIKECGVPCG